MCGIAGYLRPDAAPDEAMLREMCARLRHRGPDGDDIWVNRAAGLGLAHTRLKVQDLTPAADQPMTSADGKVTLVYNGEIYNFRELRDELRAAGAFFKSTGDTEVLLELCRRDPELSFLPNLNGMFAFALWRSDDKTLTLVRDRTGVKPLLHAELPGGGIAFASELHALRPATNNLVMDPTAVVQLLTLGFIAAPRTIFTGVQKLRPGHSLRYQSGRIEIRAWAPPISPARSAAPDAASSFREACAQIRSTFSNAVSQRLLADVPVGVFLSGGIDSAIVTAVAAKTSDRRVRTFSVSFPDNPFYDESRYAKAVADMHDTDHTVLPLSLSDVQNIIPTVQHHVGEPFADSSVLPTYLLSRLTREHVTVALSGDGADELFAGYNRYASATLNQRIGWLARTPLYAPLRSLIERLPSRRETKWGGIFSQAKRAIRSMDPGPAHRQANWMRTSDDRTLTRLLADQSTAPELIEAVVQLLWHYRPPGSGDGDLNAHLAVEWQTSLPDDMLTKVDLASMAHGLEVRSPFLDYRLVQSVFAMPWQWKLAGWKKKHLLIEAFRDMLPPLLHDRPKKGFEVPVGVWLRGPLNDFARQLIADDKCFFGPLLSREGAMATLNEHSSGRADHNFCLWALVSLLAWQQHHAAGIEVASGE
ncbi:MAG: asparagine synthase (glutamine-hydrolyzing) [Planctomycetia bacterium]|nr:asparagine synthase (glutamine-hydrolyzing) [Planctomycetia bacterium]MCC7316069.1 asparagine synthase (glutamine-hydrolyzing) [Planctomycetota bacterium]